MARGRPGAIPPRSPPPAPLTERIENVEPKLQGERWADPQYLESMRYAQERLDREQSGAW